MTNPEDKLWIFDVDGTMANDEHRKHHLLGDKREWDEFFSKQHLDEPYEAVLTVLDALKAQGHKCIVITGRDERHREATLEWIMQHHDGNFSSDDLYMRPKDDRRNDDLIKEEILERILTENPNYVVQGVFEDRHRVVDMWRRNGYYCFECNQTRETF